MKRSLLVLVTAVTTFCMMPVVSASAHGRQPLNNSSAAAHPRTQDSIDPGAIAKLRAEMYSLVDELEKMSAYLSEYQIGRQAFSQLGYEGTVSFRSQINDYRLQIKSIPPDVMAAYAREIGGSARITAAVKSIRQVYNDEALRNILNRSEILATKRAELAAERDLRSNGAGSNLNSRAGGTATKAQYLADCVFEELPRYATTADIAIAKGIALAAQTLYLALPPNIEIPIPIVGGVIKIPNVVRIILAAAWGIVSIVVTNLETDRDEGTYCENLGFAIEGNLSNDDEPIISLVLPEGYGGYAEQVQRLVIALVNLADSNQFNINCARTQLDSAKKAFKDKKWAEAFKFFRKAYQNIAAEKCEK